MPINPLKGFTGMASNKQVVTLHSLDYYVECRGGAYYLTAIENPEKVFCTLIGIVIDIARIGFYGDHNELPIAELRHRVESDDIFSYHNPDGILLERFSQRASESFK